MASLFKTDIQKLKGVGPKSAQYLKSLGVNTVGDLIGFYPRAYENWNAFQSLAQAKGKKGSCVRLKILSDVQVVRFKSKGILYKLQATDGQNFADIIFFNSKYVAESLEKNKEYLFRGNVTGNLLGFEMISPKIKKAENGFDLCPIYHQTRGITSSKIASFVQNALILLPPVVPETLPCDILTNNNLCSFDFAVKNIHFPKSEQDLKTARRRIVFYEFFVYQLSMGLIKNSARQETTVKITADCCEDFFGFLPFEMTKSQKCALFQCLEDMRSGLSMNRLLQGDVGSGKTVIAAAAAYCVAKSGYQTVIMAPTEILVRQHYETFLRFFEKSNLSVGVLHSSMKSREKKESIKKIRSGELSIVIGTSALISQGIEFANLGFIVTDEQHRFGVKQRENLIKKGSFPHVLVMSATPIPRTLAMIIYGDLDISVLGETLPGRQKIDTFLIDESKRKRAWEFIKKIVSEGGQGYIVCSSIEESESEVENVINYKEKMLKDCFKGVPVEALHGKMSASEKAEKMSRFVNGEIKVLVATTVIEVGIDVSNARIILIENADRFGISQLHQLRGRVGRSNQKSYCILSSGLKSRDALRRFDAMVASNDGFYLSEEDLKIRGPGDFFGVNQHGVPAIAVPTSFEDMDLMNHARKAAEKLLAVNPLLEGNDLRFIRRKMSEMLKESETEKFKSVIF